MEENKRQGDLQILKKHIELIEYTYLLCVKYPKSERFCLCADTKNALNEILRNLLYARKEYYPKNKLPYLNNADVELILLKTYIRLAYKFKYITLQNYETWSSKIAEISNMLGGWIKSCSKR